MTAFSQFVIAVIKSIPEGKVMTYGQIAKLAGHPKASRQVVRILHSMSLKHELPWHRVINSKGVIPLETQKSYLEAEGVITKPDGTVDLINYQWHP